MADAGWYPDAQDPNAQHYFDGQNWTGHRRPNPEVDVAAAPAEETVRRSDLPGWNQPQAAAMPPPPAAEPHAWQPQQAPTQQWGRPPAQQDTWNQPYGAPQGGPGGWPAQGGQGGWTPQPAGSGDGGWAPQGDDAPRTPPAGKRRTPLIIAGVAVVAVVAGVITFLVWPDDDAPSITYGGKEISAASDTLTAAETSVAAAVKDRKGVSNDETRCYFARPKTPASGAKKSDIDDALRCGPVLFVDGEKTAAYLSVPLTDAPDGSKVTLTAAEVRDAQPTSVADDIELVRPDGKTAPEGSGGLSVPQPPPADKDALLTAALSDTSSLKTLSASMASKYEKVTLTRAGEITRYGTGDDARSAPAGQKLIAFQLVYGSGDIDGSGNDAAELVVDGGSGRGIPAASGGTFVIAAVPESASVKIVLDKDGYEQTLSLPDGRTGSGNIDVLRRIGRAGFVGKTVNVPIQLSKGSARASTTFRTTATIASLDFWAPGNTRVHGRTPGRAILSVKVSYTESDSPGKTYGVYTGLVRLKVGGSYVQARNIASGNKILNVFDVPAGLKTGALQITGSTKVKTSDGTVTVRVKTTKSFPIRISG